MVSNKLKGVKYQLTLPRPIGEALEGLSEGTGLSKSVLVSLAIQNYVERVARDVAKAQAAQE